jgi:hypothetical protein
LKFTIKFKDGHTYVIHKRPKIAGILSDTRRILVKGMLMIEDQLLKLWSVTFFDYGEKMGVISSRRLYLKTNVKA